MLVATVSVAKFTVWVSHTMYSNASCIASMAECHYQVEIHVQLFLHQRWHVCVSVCTDGGVVAGAIIGAILFIVLIVGLMYYVIRVRGYKLSSLSLPTRSTSKADVVSYWLVIVRCEQHFIGVYMLKLCSFSVAGHLQQPQLWNRHVKTVIRVLYSTSNLLLF